MARARARRRVEVEARAKLNLALAVGPRLVGGYHEIATVFQSITLADTLVAAPRPRGFTLTVRHHDPAVRGAAPRPGAAAVPRGADNLVLRAARAVAARTGLEAGARLSLIKRIPTRAGLGGGSADAAAAVTAIDVLYGLGLSRPERLEIALGLGSDVPFCLRGGTALGFGRGERLRSVALARPLRVVIALPRWRISTARAYARVDRLKYDLTAWKRKLRSTQLLGRNQLRAEKAMQLGNTFEEVLGTRRSSVLSLFARLREAGATEVRMTGSGSAVFGILEPGVREQEVVGRFAGRERLYLARSAGSGLRLRTLP